MKFGAVPVGSATGSILAHSLGLPDGRLKKGRVLSAADIDRLRVAGIFEVVVARPEADDLLEDEAARRIAAALAPDAASRGLRVAAPFTGRANLYAETAGLLRVDAATVHSLNALDEALTLATLPDCTRVAPRQMIATVKVIPYGAPAAAVAEAETGARADLTLILTGSATSDRGDVGPAALIAAGGTLGRFGMPVDPGNLLFLGEHRGRPVIGLPGCARSPKLNGADWVLERLACGVPVTPDDIAAMGVGGLLKEIPSRPEPRAGGAEAPRRPVIGAVLLAAGGSTRMRGTDKLLQEIDGVPLLRHVAQQLQAAAVDEVRVVLRPGDADREAALAGLDLVITLNPRAVDGMATSIAAGVAALDPGCDAVLIVMADMPEVRADDIDRMIAGFDPGEDRAIVRAVTPAGRAGHPVLFGRRFFEALQRLEGDRGARDVVAEHPEFQVDVVVDADRSLTDLDTPEDWAAWRLRTERASKAP